ncbi:MAG: HDIG domain-containing metalloprotein [Bdellovibrionia bacterium]
MSILSFLREFVRRFKAASTLAPVISPEAQPVIQPEVQASQVANPPTPIVAPPQFEKSQPVETPSQPEILTARSSLPQLPTYLDEEEQARRLIAMTVARQATRFVSQVSTARVKFTHLQLKDGIKGKIVGKDGRNARHFEERAGVDLLLNDEPDAVMISSFDPFRREVARVALTSLVRDGRIQPARIEEVLVEARTQVDQDARDAGRKAALELGVQNLHPAIARVLGTLKFRQSFGQNQLEHSIETAWICGNLAAELGFNVAEARRAGLLHDLGKALDQTHDGGHAQAGAEFAKKNGESARITQAIAAHHEEFTPQSWLDHLVIAADALSGARPGARHGSTQNVLDRATQMEKVALEVPGVNQAFAVQAGRELRVFVDSEKVNDSGVREVARAVSSRIQDEVRFPGQIKVTVLRELRVVELVSR